jgi:hypothetical protein
MFPMKKKFFVFSLFYCLVGYAQPTLIYQPSLDKKFDSHLFDLLKECPCDANLKMVAPKGSTTGDPDGNINVPTGSNSSGETTIVGAVTWNQFMRNANRIDSLKKKAIYVKPIIVAILDSGADSDNPFLQPFIQKQPPHIPKGNSGGTTAATSSKRKIIGNYGVNMFPMDEKYPEPVDEWNHGTFISGIIAGYASLKSVINRPQTGYTALYNDNQVNVQQLNIKIFDGAMGKGDLFDALCGINYALDHGAKVINASWDARGGKNVRDAFVQTMKLLKKKGAILVVAIGNDPNAKIEGAIKSYPGAFADEDEFKDNVICVGGFNYFKNRESGFTSRAHYVDVEADADTITSFALKNQVGTWNGTSFAAAIVSRLVAVHMGKNINSLPKDVKETVFTYLGETHFYQLPNYKQLQKTPVGVPKPGEIKINPASGAAKQ